MGSRSGTSEVIGSVTMLAVTMALLSGAALVGVSSITDAASLVSSSIAQRQSSTGLLVSVIAIQSNATGTFVWLYNFGWAEGRITRIYADGGAIGWSSCNELKVGALCLVKLQPGIHGQLTIVAGGQSIEAVV